MAKQEKELLEQLSTLLEIIALMPGNVYWVNKENIYQGCNNNMAEASGLNSAQEIVGKRNSELPWNAKAGSLPKELDLINEAVMATGQAKVIEEPGTLPNGTKVIYLSTKVPLHNKNKEVSGLVGISVDITQLKNTEKELLIAKEAAETANQAKTEFLENMRHDIRTPLTGIVGFSEILKMEFDDPRIQDYADNLIASSHALLHLMDDVLEAIRVSSGEIPKLKKKFDFQTTLEHIIALNLAKAAQKKINLCLEIDPNIPRYLVGDKIRLHRIALELVANALNFTDDGFVKLSAILGKRNQRDLIIKLIVEDTGIGIHKDKQQDIYVQFKRLTPSYQGIYKGAGLGLSVIKQFIDDLAGEIYVESEPKKGTTFTCLLPLQEALFDDASGIDVEIDAILDNTYESTKLLKSNLEQPVIPTPEQIQHRILVVEDSPIAQKVAQSLLSKFNCQTDIADCGQKAVELANSNTYDLIFMDIGLPDIDGYEVTHRIRVNELSKKTHTPIIALTAHAVDENKKRCIEAGMNAVLTKPLTLKNCSDIIESFIPGQRKEESETYPRHGLPEDASHLFDLSQFPLLNLEEGISTLGDKRELFDMLKLLINGELANDLTLMKEAHDNNNWDKTQQIAHKIKGGVVYVGATRITMACQYLDRYWKTGQKSLLEQLYQQVISVIDDSIEAIQDVVNQ